MGKLLGRTECSMLITSIFILSRISLAVPYSQGTLPHLHFCRRHRPPCYTQTETMSHQLHPTSDCVKSPQIRWHADEASGPLRLYAAWGETSIKQRPVPQVDPSQLAQWPPSLSSTASMEEGCFRLRGKARPRRGRAQHLFQKVCSHIEIIFRCTVKSATAPACAWSEVWSSKSHWP